MFRRCTLALCSLAAAPSAQGLGPADPGPAPLRPAQGLLDAPRKVLFETGLVSRAVADLDLDGRPDLVTFRHDVQGFAVGMVVCLNRGNGRFRALPEVALPPSTWLDLVRTGDLTGDGRVDVVVSAPVLGPNDALLVLPGRGDGTFAPGLLLDVQSEFGSLVQGTALGDMDADGVLELVEVHRRFNASSEIESYVAWWAWDGAGFVPSGEVFAGFDYGDSLVAVDLSGKSTPDVVVGTDNGIASYVLRAQDGGGLATGKRLPIHGLGLASSGRYVNKGDLDGDGDEDLVFTWNKATGDDAILQVVENREGSLVRHSAQRLFGYRTAHLYELPSLVEDWDLDGDPDLIFSYGNLVLAENTGDLLFRGAASIPIATRVSIYFPLGGVPAGVADLNGDGYPDFAAGEVVKYGSGTFEDTGQIVSTGGESRAEDIDGDADIDILTFDGQFFLNDGHGRFESAGSAWPAQPTNFVYDGAVALGDFDGDQLLDFVVGVSERVFGNPEPYEFRNMELLTGVGSGLFVDAGPAGPAGVRMGDSQSYVLVPVDPDGDGNLDLVQEGGWWENDGTGFFGTFHAEWEGDVWATGDVDADGDVDLVTHVTPGGGYSLRRNDGAGGFTGTLLTPESSRFGEAHLVDLDGDTDLDAAVTSDDGSQRILLFENVGGSYSLRAELPSQDWAHDNLLFDDVDRDGRVDIVGTTGTAGFSGDLGLVWRNRGEFLFRKPLAYHVPRTSGEADLDGDGDLDLYGRLSLRNWRVTEVPRPGAR